jgi:hypothetical protein
MPSIEPIIIQRRSPGGPGVVDEEVQRAGSLARRGCQLVHAGEAREVGDDRLARTDRSQAVRAGVASHQCHTIRYGASHDIAG